MLKFIFISTKKKSMYEIEIAYYMDFFMFMTRVSTVVPRLI